jgi:succinate dehydrogenase / fumarate reductase, cytochrome b subunit
MKSPSSTKGRRNGGQSWGKVEQIAGWGCLDPWSGLCKRSSRRPNPSEWPTRGYMKSLNCFLFAPRTRAGLLRNPTRPMSPHLRIYKPQITSILSIFHRVTGIVLTLSAFFFILVLGFLQTGTFGITSWLGLCQLSAEWAGVVGFVAKLTLSTLGATAVFSFFYHFCNGIRHLMWDWFPTKTLTNKQTTTSGVLMVVSAFVTSALTLFWLL